MPLKEYTTLRNETVDDMNVRHSWNDVGFDHCLTSLHAQVYAEAERLKKLSLRIDYYKVLSVDKSAVEREVKKAYRCAFTLAQVLSNAPPTRCHVALWHPEWPHMFILSVIYMAYGKCCM